MEPSHRQSDNHADRQQEPCLTWDRLWPHGSILLLEFVLRITRDNASQALGLPNPALRAGAQSARFPS